MTQSLNNEFNPNNERQLYEHISFPNDNSNCINSLPDSMNHTFS